MYIVKVGSGFGENIWLVTRIISAGRIKAEEGVNYALTLQLSESNCPLRTAGGAEAVLLYSGACSVQHTAPSKTCQVMVNRKKSTYRTLSSTHALTLIDQVWCNKHSRLSRLQD